MDFVEGDTSATVLIQSIPTHYQYVFVTKSLSNERSPQNCSRFVIAGGQSSRSHSLRTSARCFSYSENEGSIQEEINMYQSRKQFAFVHMSGAHNYAFALGGIQQ